jgi:hypothetical protein
MPMAVADAEPVPVTPMSGQSILLLMKKEGLRPNIWTYTSLLSLYTKCAGRPAGLGAGAGVGLGEVSLALAGKVREEMAAAGIKPTGPFINNYMALIGKLALTADAHLRDGRGLLAWGLDEGVEPDIITMNALLQVLLVPALEA